MWDIVLECIRTLVICLILIYIWRIGHARGLNLNRGWAYIIWGWSLILFGSMLDITDNFESLNWLIVVGDTEVEAFLEKFVGLLLGYVLLFVGFLFWLPAGAMKIDNMKNEFVSAVSHELRTPLTAIYGSLKLVASGALGKIPEKASDTLDNALRNSERLTLIVNDILDIEKLESGRMVFNLRPHDIIALVKESIDANLSYGDKYKIQFELTQDSVPATANVDADRFMQVMSNLLSNSAKFSPESSTVEIAVSKQDNNVRIAIKDKGIGIDEESKPLVFQKFTQSETNNKKHLLGTGLGLAISKGFVENMGGNISFISSAGQGTTFYIDLLQA